MIDINKYIIEKLIINKNSSTDKELREIIIDIINDHLQKKEKLKENDYEIEIKQFDGDYDVIVKFSRDINPPINEKNISKDLCIIFHKDKEKYNFVHGYSEEEDDEKNTSAKIIFTFYNEKN